MEQLLFVLLTGKIRGSNLRLIKISLRCTQGCNHKYVSRPNRSTPFPIYITQPF